MLPCAPGNPCACPRPLQLVCLPPPFATCVPAPSPFLLPPPAALAIILEDLVRRLLLLVGASWGGMR